MSIRSSDGEIDDFLKDIISHERIEKLKEEIEYLRQQVTAERNYRKSEEDHILKLIQSVSESEVKLELLGRSIDTYQSVVSNIIQNTSRNTSSNNNPYKQTYSSLITKMVLSIYSNQLKFMQVNNNNYINKRYHSSSEDMRAEHTQDKSSYQTTKSYNDCDTQEEEDVEDEEIQNISYQNQMIHKIYSSRPLSAPILLDILEEEEAEEDQEEELYSDTFTYSHEGSSRYDSYITDDGNQGENHEDECVIRDLLDSMIQRIEQLESHHEKKSSHLSACEDEDLMTFSPIHKPRTPSVVLVEPYGDDEVVDRESEEEIRREKEITELNRNLKELNERMDELNDAFNRQSIELMSATQRLEELDSKMKDSLNSRRKSISDELDAWKDLVHQQKAVLEKITSELEDAHREAHEKNQQIQQLLSNQHQDDEPVEDQSFMSADVMFQVVDLNVPEEPNGNPDEQNMLNVPEPEDSVKVVVECQQIESDVREIKSMIRTLARVINFNNFF